MDPKILSKLVLYGCNVLENEPLSKHCSFKIGGLADCFIEIPNEKALYLFLENNDGFFVLGDGTNILFSDNGYRGTVISLIGDFKKIEVIGESIFCGGGATLANALNIAIKNNLTGLEFTAGIPGTVGGAVYGNAGTRENWIGSIVKSVEVYRNAKKISLKKSQISFSYRQSDIKNSVISSTYFSLKKTVENDSFDVVTEYIQKRLKVQPVNFPSAGSIFKNPQGFSAGKLIEEVGLKGARIGGAQISELHGNFIVNTGGATAADVLTLITLTKEKIYKQFNIILETEIQIIK